MEGYQALEALGRSRRKVWIGLVGSPLAAWLWADTIAISRAFEAGRTSPSHGGGSPEALVGYLWFYFSMGLEGIVGRTGLHLLFAILVAALVGVGLWGSIQRRDLDRRGVTARALRHERGVGRRWSRQAFAPRDAIDEPSLGRDGSWALSALVEAIRLGWRLLPLASMALTAFLAWTALAR